MKKNHSNVIASRHKAANSSSNRNALYVSKSLPKLTLTLFTLVCFSTLTLSAKEYKVNSAEEFNDLDLSPGDVVLWKNGSYGKEHKISFTDNGTASNPITLKAETPGGVIFTGKTTLEISGNYVIIDGFYWNGGAGTENHVQFRKNNSYANYSTIRNCAFNDLEPDGTDKHRWIVIYGTNNTVENCSFLNKNSPGALILVEMTYNNSAPIRHQIINNYFYNYAKRDSDETNAGDSETIRIGSSKDQNKSASTIVAGNYFYKADGEDEIITNKSADNVYKNNTFRACRGSLVLRHGARATVDGNFFLGENIKGTGGIRVSDSYHTITNNYIQDVISRDDKWNNGITLVGGSDTSGGTSNGYQKVDAILVAFNTIYNSDSPIFYNDRSSHDPTGIIAYNLVYTTKSKIVGGDISGTGQGMDYKGNVFGGSSIGISDSGIKSANANFYSSGEIAKPSSSGAAANAAASSYSSSINYDIEGRSRPNSNMDVGAHEVSGGSGSTTNTPITNAQVGKKVGACFLDSSGKSLSNCSDDSTTATLSLSSISQFDESGGSKTTTVKSNQNWSVSANTSWISTSKISGYNNGTISITTLANTSTSFRSGTVTVNGGGITRTLTISQTGAKITTLTADGLINIGIAGNPVSVYASTEQVDNSRNNVAKNSLDKNKDTKWAGNGIGATITYNLGATYTLDQIRIATQSGKTYFYEIQVSNDGNSFTSVANVTSNSSGNFENYNLSNTAKYVRIVGNGQSNGSTWCSIFEIEFYGDLEEVTNGTSSCSGGANLALDAAVIEYSAQQNTTNGVANLVDGNDDNRWSASGFPQAVVIDLGAVYNVDEINLYPYSNRAYQFKVQGATTSPDHGYKTMRDATTNTTGGPVINRTFTPQNVRYVRLTITGASGYSGSWSSIEEFEVLCAQASAAKNEDITATSTSNISIFPNPANNFLDIDTKGYTNNTQISIYSLVGQVVQTRVIKGKNNRLDISELPAGAYFMQVDNFDVLQQEILRFIKK